MTESVNMLMLSQILASHEQLSDWAKWLVTSTRTPAVELRVFLDRALRHLPAPKRVRKRLQSADAGGVDAILHELLMFEVCTILRMNDLVAWIIPKDALSSCFSTPGIT